MEKKRGTKVKKVSKMTIPIIMLAIIIVISVLQNSDKQEEVIQITSKEELEKIYNQQIGEETTLEKLIKLPFSLLKEYSYSVRKYDIPEDMPIMSNKEIIDMEPSNMVGDSTNLTLETTKEYSTTNIQVENVDEADITKTDGDYLYSLSESDVIITDVREPEKTKVIAKITESSNNNIPEDLLLYQDKLVVIYENAKASHSYYAKQNITYVAIYDIMNKEKPKKIKSYELEQGYYTSRCIEGKLYVIATGILKKENDHIITYYKEDEEQVDEGFSKINRIKDIETNHQTILSVYDLNQIQEKVKISSYLMNIENAYVSQNNIYLLEEKYKSNYGQEPKMSDIFGWKGILGAFDDKAVKEKERGYYTNIYKFNLLDNGTIKFNKKVEEKGRTINQFSIDEYQDNLRIALYDDEGSQVVIWDKNMKKIGQTQKLAKGEKMYSSRFLGEKAYLVTYQTIDPLFVIDLKDPTSPQVLGELKIPGYSTYLHPYDENHIIGIGMQTKEKINRNASGKVTSTTATVTGMKMALFDVSDVKNPVQISETTIGDSRTTSAILTNHKALLFSKEKQLLAIPVNNYREDFEINTSSDNYSNMVNEYKNYSKPYVSEGYFVYQINLKDGFHLKGTITHEKQTNRGYSTQSKLLRGLYIENNLYTISEDFIKINQLEDLKEIHQVRINEKK